ncbi:hypothetical protein Hamer_G003400 [Homarus americanus]|uniref:Uncharacterized protein n=1 Tax=Homarus americanus TaxID=6706 RepID=A0A8J5N6C3_HOMAM|nr:hypothetical protein Hamer_G003400 [Homarus americanus]
MIGEPAMRVICERPRLASDALMNKFNEIDRGHSNSTKVWLQAFIGTQKEIDCSTRMLSGKS